MAGYPWFRMYHEMIEDPKIGTLSDQEFRLWVELLCLACAFGKDGDTGLTVEELCWKLRRNVSETLQSRLCNGCISIEETINGRKTVIIKNWKKRQFQSDSSTTRVRKCRELKKNIHENVSETLQKRKRNGTDTDTDTDKIKRKNKKPLSDSTESDQSGKGDYPDVFEKFWAAYPKREGKGDAFKAYEKIKSPRPSLNKILDSIEIHKKTISTRKFCSL